MLDLNNLPVEAKLQLDIESYASQIEYALSQYMKEPPKGIYVCNKLEPVMIDGGVYYHGDKTSSKALQIVKDLNEVTTSIYDKDYKLIIPKQFIINKDRLLSNYPILPYHGIKIIKIMVDDYIYNNLQYLNRHSNISVKIQNHLSNVETDDQFEEILDKIQRIFQPILVDIERFIGKDDWYIYGISLRERIIDIEKLVDHRIYEWTKMHLNIDESSSE
jgi:hypothetical protein